jgi:exodeoxyribonuclease VII large subunit
VLIVCRGGGSLEDLWTFNEEPVARAIAASKIPVVNGVGHETDFSIADFAADVRAATPTAAAVAASPDRAALAAEVAARRRRLGRDLARVLERAQQRLDLATRRLLTPGERIARHREALGQAWKRIRRSLAADHERRFARITSLRAALAHLDPTQVLARGYSLVRDSQGRLVRTSAQLERGETIDIAFSEGAAQAEVRRTR